MWNIFIKIVWLNAIDFSVDPVHLEFLFSLEFDCYEFSFAMFNLILISIEMWRTFKFGHFLKGHLSVLDSGTKLTITVI